MKLIAISRVKNELDIVEAFVRHHSQLFNTLIVLDDGSTDGTYEVLQQLQAAGLPLVLMRDPSVGYEQSRYMSRLLRMAVDQFGADWVMPLDADEFVETDPEKTLAQILHGRESELLNLSWNNFVWRPEDDEGAEPNPVMRLRFRMPPSPNRLNKVLVPAKLVADSSAELDQGNHNLVLDGQVLPSKALYTARLCHFPIRSVSQYASKVAVGYLQYSATPDWDHHIGFHYLAPYRLLTEGLDRLVQSMAAQSRRYSLEDNWPETGEPREAPFRYQGGPLRFTRESASMLSNILHYAEMIANKLAERSRQIEITQDGLLAATGVAADIQADGVRGAIDPAPRSPIPAANKPPAPKHRFQSFWSGGALTPYEAFCLKSFIDCGHAFDLYTFELDIQVPTGVRVCDAADLFRPEELFVYEQEEFGQGSPAAFANLFRYKLLAEKGGWWVDTDVVCLARDIPIFTEFFAREDTDLVNTAVLFFEPRHPVMMRCLDEALKLGRNVRWGDTGPRLLTRVVKELGREDQALARHLCYPVHYSEAVDLLRPSKSASISERTAASPFIHLWNEMLRHRGVQKGNLPPKGSMLRQWIERHPVDGWSGEYGAETLEYELLRQTELHTRAQETSRLAAELRASLGGERPIDRQSRNQRGGERRHRSATSGGERAIDHRSRN